MSLHLQPLLQLLSDGNFHSGDELGKILGISRAAVWKVTKKMAELGLDVHSVKGKGYRLSQGLELLNHELIFSALDAALQKKIVELEILGTIESTNSHAQKVIKEREVNLSGGKLLVCLAEQQTAGRGRRGRQWVSPFGTNMYLSIVREFESGAVGLEGLSLVVGLALVKALNKEGIEGLTVKWPNDVLWQNKKLAGILLEMSGDLTGACQVVIGLGLNIQMNSKTALNIDQPWVDLSTIMSSVSQRNKIIAGVINEVCKSLNAFEEVGFSGFQNEWNKVDALKNCEVILEPQGITGIVKGVDISGALLMKTKGGIKTFHGGEVSVRKQVPHDS